MKVKFLGAARTVTGSCFILEINGARFAVDCGMYQGNREIEKRNWSIEPYEPQNLDFILVTHAHIDHSGLLPRLVREGFKGNIYVTPPTKDLLEIMLYDSAHIQEMEAAWKNKKRARRGQEQLEPLYTQNDVDRALSLLKPIEYFEEIDVASGVKVMYKDAGHILGSAFIEIWVEENDQKFKLVFSGDLGRPEQLLIKDPSCSEVADFLFLESTYGDRDHKNETQSREELAEAINYSYSHGEKVIIPAFAVERTQEVIYSLYLLYKEGKLPSDMPVFLDSPLAIKATQIFRKHHRYFDLTTRELLQRGEDPLQLPNLKFTLSAQESMQLNTLSGPAIIISASGMANAGRIKHHLRHNIWREGASIVFVGFQASGTPGRKIVDGARTIRILGEELAVKARVFTINGFSAHAGQSQILDWLSCFRNHGMKIFLVHGEYNAQKTLGKLITERYGHEVHIPDYLEECTLKPEKVFEPKFELEKARPAVNWDFLLTELQSKVDTLTNRIPDFQKLTWTDQTELRDDLLEINTRLSRLLSEIPTSTNSESPAKSQNSQITASGDRRTAKDFK
jgi:metallo-beta-lactamase family protein